MCCRAGRRVPRGRGVSDSGAGRQVPEARRKAGEPVAPRRGSGRARRARGAYPGEGLPSLLGPVICGLFSCPVRACPHGLCAPRSGAVSFSRFWTRRGLKCALRASKTTKPYKRKGAPSLHPRLVRKRRNRAVSLDNAGCHRKFFDVDRKYFDQNGKNKPLFFRRLLSVFSDQPKK